MPKQYTWKNAVLEFLEVLLGRISGKSRARTWNQHVVPYQEDWAVRREGNKRITSKHGRQDTAIRKAKSIAKKRKADVIIHRADGTIRDRINYD